MKKLTGLCIICALGLCLFVGCSSSGDTTSNASNGVVSDAEDMMSDVVSSGEKVVSGTISGTESIANGVISGTESMINGMTGSGDNSANEAD